MVWHIELNEVIKMAKIPEYKIFNGKKYWLAKKTGYFKKTDITSGIGKALKNVGIPHRIIKIGEKYYIYYAGNK